MVTMARYTITTHVDAAPGHVFALWTNLERMGEWVGGVTGVSEVPQDHDTAMFRRLRDFHLGTRR